MGIKLDGYSPDYFGLVFLKDHYHPLTPEMRNKTMVIPGMSGEWDFGSERGPKPFNLPFEMIEYDLFERQRKLNTLVAFLYDAYGKPREIKLTFDYEPDKFYSVKLAEKIDPERLISTARFVISFKAHKPEKKFILKSDEITWDTDIPIMSDIMWDTGLTDWQITSPQSFEIVNNGQLAIPLTLKIVGSGTNVTFSANGKTLSLGTFSNKTIEILDNSVVKFDGVADLTSTNGVFPILLPGVNTVTVNGTNLNLTVSESLTYQYI